MHAAPKLERLRLSSIDCIEAGGDLIAAFAEEPRLMPHLHLSLQSGDDLILKRMKRRHRRADAAKLCAELRRLRPGIVFGADVIAGFPTETDAMFENTLALVAECGLTHLHVFPFSARPGTPAAKMPPVAPEIVKQRAKRLREAGDTALRTHLDAQTGKVLRVLTERGGTGRTEDFTRVKTGGVPPSLMIEMVATGTTAKCLKRGAWLTSGFKSLALILNPQGIISRHPDRGDAEGEITAAGKAKDVAQNERQFPHHFRHSLFKTTGHRAFVSRTPAAHYSVTNCERKGCALEHAGCYSR